MWKETLETGEGGKNRFWREEVVRRERSGMRRIFINRKFFHREIHKGDTGRQGAGEMFPRGYDLKRQRGKVFRGRDSNGQMIFTEEEISLKGRESVGRHHVEEIISGKCPWG